jgi:hypothetical protein
MLSLFARRTHVLILVPPHYISFLYGVLTRLPDFALFGCHEYIMNAANVSGHGEGMKFSLGALLIVFDLLIISQADDIDNTWYTSCFPVT